MPYKEQLTVSENDFAQGFGTNEWIVEDMREAYLADPASVTQSWREFFSENPQYLAGQSPAMPSKPLSASVGVQIPGATTASASRRPVLASEDVSRSDLPPAPTAQFKSPTSPYAYNQAHSDASETSNGVVESVDTLKGASARTAKNMEASLQIPTATSARAIPAKVLIENRLLINTHLASTRGGKVSFTHLIAWALVESLAEMPEMNVAYTLDEKGKPALHNPAHVNLGLAIDVPSANGERRLLVPSVKNADTLDLASFIDAYDALVVRARKGQLTVDDFKDTTATLTNPGMIGTLNSVPRLMPGQGLIMGVGAMTYPAAFAGASPETLARQAVGKVLTLSNTYDHRVIQGAQSGELLRLMERKLMGLDGFWNRSFKALRIPHEPVHWDQDVTYDPLADAGKPARVAELIHAFRQRGHLAADTDPLAYRLRRHPDLNFSSYGLSLWDLDRVFPTGGLGGKDRATLREILQMLRDAYSRYVGVEYMHIQDPAQRRWWQERMEGVTPSIDTAERRRILTKLMQAEAFEVFLQTKYVGQKRFSLEGGESLIVLLDRLIDDAAHDGIEEAAIGMAHRGRLNVLTNIAGKSYGQVFDEFDGNYLTNGQGSGDVKYHLGTTGTFTGTDDVTTKVSLAANPSHLETVDGVLEGIVRAKLDRSGSGADGSYNVLPILVHGDAAFAGQGVVYEVLNMSQLPGYHTGGTIHVIVNNQIGFTTGNALGRSTTYPSDLAKGLQVPIFHVNGDAPESVARVARWAWEYRQEFHKDVIIDLVCYRRRGHNEGDDPSMTQPVMYNLIDRKPSTFSVYTTNLVGRGDLTEEQCEQLLDAYRDNLEHILNEARAGHLNADTPAYSGPKAGETSHSQPTAVAREVIERIGDAQVSVPEGFQVHSKLMNLLRKRQSMSRQGGIDWGFGELLAFGSLLMEGVPVHMTGEDVRRATFAQRHAVMHDQRNGSEWTPLDYLTPNQAKLSIVDSLLSEYGAMAFEYGYSVERSEGLNIWEGQFGDFANGAQTVIDEYVSSAEQKWGQHSGLVLLLPHGLEGQGPDHSSARIERYLQLCAQDNMRVVQPSTPANHFHTLRDQARREPRRPLILISPKQMLRLKAAVSPVEDFISGGMQTVIGENDPEVLAAAAANKVDRVLLCSGRIYWDLLAHRQHAEDKHTAIVRLEQLYPLDEPALLEALAPFAGAELVWVQDEPRNQGAWPWLALHLPDSITAGRLPRVVARPEAAAPAVGTSAAHVAQQKLLLDEAFAR
ncbi:MAG: multifunctional oxoglutarate decarboxylase/oxoglutarate dehydrogenase thiamine pyrophosphate-binding subunit/dihydrolipoyllysine-residue succinyltransferase subunit [Actinomyces graevenitzii]|uniref:Multifunctional oxoglutarate decarboxylase/oxoglutarate dehydrogenase thiamine pyrophosphate-binding subunit/dihydrolipoyllysine-residue succinyltransferase subunit n=1 Tax=Actinomyces graevenitzii TaxID=55565 RepID=A0A9E7AKD8_9ACTO|nr:MAG: multifunctional oxoglutarate decarboxylase/oxoglutarate dehydrogenase thiamine pyrophosphate-binding subunit/dihydrolipoyllysine-residue succinyltransferase subunit [Actinomyces graevenitzii]